MPSTVASPVGMRRKRDDDESQARSATGATGIDSLVPVVQPRKRRKTTFLRAFQSFNLQRESDDEGGGDDDADSSQAVANDEEGNGGSSTTTTSSLEDVEGVEEEEDQLLLSDKEIEQRNVNRKVMLELVFGTDATKSPVDGKLQNMVRSTMRHAGGLTTERESVDDMKVETCYSRPSAPMQRSTLHRSNSLPDIHAHDSSEHMDTDSSG